MKTLLKCLSATEKHYERNSFIFMAGGSVTSIGIVLSGSVHIIQEDFWGRRTILSDMSAGGLFGEAFSCSAAEKLPVSVIASLDSDILLIDYNKVITSCSSACEFHFLLIKNMFSIFLIGEELCSFNFL